MDIQGITFPKTFSFIDIIYSTIGYPPCYEFNKTTWLERLRHHRAFIPIYIWGIIMTLNTILYVVMNIRESVSIWEILSQALVWTYFSTAMIKMFVVIKNRDKLASLIELLQSIWPKIVKTDTERQFLEQYMKSNTMWVSWYAYLSVTCFFIVNCNPILMMTYKTITGDKDDKTEKLLPFLTWFPFDEYKGIAYPLAYIYLFYGSHVGSASQIGYDSLFCMILAHICMHYKLLGEDLRSTVQDAKNCQDTNEVASEERLRKCIEKHQLLIEIRERMENIFTDVIFTNFLFSSFNICIVGFLFVIQDGLGKLKFVIMLMTLLAQLFLLCWFGQELVDNSMSISDAAYDCLWYTSSQRFRKMVIYMIHHSQIPQKLVAMQFWDITLQSFTSVVSASWSYFALLNTIFGDLSESIPKGGLLT